MAATSPMRGWTVFFFFSYEASMCLAKDGGLILRKQKRKDIGGTYINQSGSLDRAEAEGKIMNSKLLPTG